MPSPTVSIEHRGEPHRILVHVIGQDDDWRIANIIYDYGKSLLDHYRSITGAQPRSVHLWKIKNAPAAMKKKPSA